LRTKLIKAFMRLNASPIAASGSSAGVQPLSAFG
jgi:hypothetical protein